MSPSAARSQTDLWIVLAAAILLALAAGSVLHFSAPVAPARLQVLNDVVAGRSVAYTPYPIGYIELAGHALRWNAKHGLTAIQGLLYILTVLLAFAVLRDLGAPGRWPLIGALAVAIYPNLLLTIARFQDTCISGFFMMAFVWLVVRLKRDGLTASSAATAGLLFGAMLLVRPNVLTIAPIALWAAFYGRKIDARQIALVAGSAVLALGVLAAVLIPAKGSLLIFDPYYAADAFANGNHQHALEGTLRDYNGEMTMPRSFQELGLPLKGLDVRDDGLAAEYRSVAWRFIREHPGQYVLLELVKIVNIFRPDYRNAERSAIPRFIALPVQTAIAAIFFVWCFLRWRSGRKFHLNEGFYVVPLLVLYFGPFVIAASDPRYRFPIDALLIVDSVLCLT
ncbi:MAG TPA: hypothetical protein VEF06_06505 [Bryobacteraceae bacterium]|nr:hypothetical protein [Bryobacteraceae bacterium]